MHWTSRPPLDPTPRLLPTSAYGTVRHMSRAVKVLHEKVRTAEGIVVEFKVWRVRDIRRYPEGFRYSFFAVRDGVVLVGYDNHVPKGHHRHFGGKQEPYAFEGLDKLRADFKRDLERARLRITEGA